VQKCVYGAAGRIACHQQLLACQLAVLLLQASCAYLFNDVIQQ
jgi:hypothetical protein